MHDGSHIYVIYHHLSLPFTLVTQHYLSCIKSHVLVANINYICDYLVFSLMW